jgi:hypothetical protein
MAVVEEFRVIVAPSVSSGSALSLLRSRLVSVEDSSVGDNSQYGVTGADAPTVG